MTRPEKPNLFDYSNESYLQHNRYFNEAEKVFDQIQGEVNLVESYFSDDIPHPLMRGVLKEFYESIKEIILLSKQSGENK